MRRSKNRGKRAAGNTRARVFGLRLHPGFIKVRSLLFLLLTGSVVLLAACASSGQPGSALPPSPTTSISVPTTPGPLPETSSSPTPTPGPVSTGQATGSPATPGSAQATVEAAQSTLAGDSGIEGWASIGPACPGPVRLEQPCPDKPYHGTFSVLDSGNHEVARFQTDLDGKFHLPLLPGIYTVHAITTTAYPRASDQAVTVRAGQYTTLNIPFDSGMR